MSRRAMPGRIWLTAALLPLAVLIAVEIYGVTPPGKLDLYSETGRSAGVAPSPKTYDMPPEQTYQVAAAVISRMPNWRLDASPAATPDGTLHAEVKKVFGIFTDHVVVRIEADGRNARVDVASASRIEDGVLGANAGNIRALQSAMDERLPPAS